MPAYHYTAINSAGKQQKGVLEADNEKHIRQLLRGQALFPLSIQATDEKKQHQANAYLSRLGFKQGLSAAELARMIRQFATLLAAGLPLEECLLTVAEQTEKPRLQALLLSVRSKVLEGHSLHIALADYPQAFSSLFCATVAAGEKSGHLDQVLLRLADFTEQQARMRQKLKTALIYPIMIVVVACSILGFLLAYVVPKMVAVYAHLNQALPLLTELLIAISHAVRSAGLYFILLLFLAVFAWCYYLKKYQSLRLRSHLFLLKLPLIGNAIKTANTARFSRTLSILSASGVSVLEAMHIAAQLLTALPIRFAVEEAVQRVQEGMSIHLALKETKFFQPMSIHMMASGEASGQLENMLERIASDQEEDISRLIDVSLALFEPAIILIMGSIVLFIVLAVLLPIFELNQFTG